MTRYYTLEQDELKPLDLPIEVNGEAKLHPSKEECAALSAYTIADEPEPEHSAGVVLQQDGWQLRDNEWHKKWKLVPIPTPEPGTVRAFSKLKVVGILMQMNLWDTVKDWIERMGLYDLYAAAQVFSNDNEYFNDAMNDLKTQLNLSDEQVEQILQAAEIEVS